MKEITAISTSDRIAGRSPSVSWCRGNYPGWVPVLSAMIWLLQRRARKREPVPAMRHGANPREREGLPTDQNDLKVRMVETIADESLHPSLFRYVSRQRLIESPPGRIRIK